SRAPERLTTSPHLAESVRINSANSSGVPPAGSSPIIAKRSLNVCDAIALLIAALSLSTIGRGTPAGAMAPLQGGAAEPAGDQATGFDFLASAMGRGNSVAPRASQIGRVG